ncbi:MAG: hypothetical protein DLM64_00925, partial [Solirubrobacterales bacterium]
QEAGAKAEPDPKPKATGTKREEFLAQTVHSRRAGASVPFGELTLEDVRGRADELRAAVGFGPTARVAPVARAWRELTMAMEQGQVGTVKELDPEALSEIAPRLWVVPPGGSLL